MLRLRSDEQLVALLRAGHDEAFQIIHDRYRQRLFAYTRQMLPLRQDAEDALQEVFERAYASLRAGDRDLALRPWLYRIAHNRCVDHLRRPIPPPPDQLLQLGATIGDPVQEADRREALRRLLEDVRRLPEQQRSALLMRELGGMSYAEVAEALGASIPAVKSLLVRARISLVQAVQARDTACEEIRAELALAHESRARAGAQARRHMRDCAACREYRGELRGVSRQLLALAPAIGLPGLIARLLGGGGGGGAAAAGGSAASGLAGGGAAATTGAAGLGTLAGSAGHMATIIAATALTAGGAAALTHTTATAHARPHPRVHVLAAAAPASSTAASTTAVVPADPAPTRAASAVATPTPTRPHPGNGGGGSTVAGAGVPARAPDITSIRPAVSRLRPDNNALEPMPDPVLPTGPATTPATGAGSPTATATAPGSGPLTIPATGTGSGASTPGTATGASTGTATGATPGTTGPGTVNSGNTTGTATAAGTTSGGQSGSGLTPAATSTANESPARYGPRTV